MIKLLHWLTKETLKKGSIGYVVCDFFEPNEAYDVEFWNDSNIVPYGYETFLVNELEKA